MRFKLTSQNSLSSKIWFLQIAFNLISPASYQRTFHHSTKQFVSSFFVSNLMPPWFIKLHLTTYDFHPICHFYFYSPLNWSLVYTNDANNLLICHASAHQLPQFASARPVPWCNMASYWRDHSINFCMKTLFVPKYTDRRSCLVRSMWCDDHPPTYLYILQLQSFPASDHFFHTSVRSCN